MTEKGKEIWNRIDDLRGRMSVRELCEKAHLPEGSIQTTRSMQTLPKVDTLYALAKALNTTIEYLYAEEEITDNFDAPLFQKLSTSQDFIDICEKLVFADATEIEMVKRILGIAKMERGGGVAPYLSGQTD